MSWIHIYNPSRLGKTFSINIPGRPELGQAIYGRSGQYSVPCRCLGTDALNVSNMNVLSHCAHLILYFMSCLGSILKPHLTIPQIQEYKE